MAAKLALRLALVLAGLACLPGCNAPGKRVSYERIGDVSVDKFSRGWSRFFVDPPRVCSRLQLRVYRSTVDINGVRIKRQGHEVEEVSFPGSLRPTLGHARPLPLGDAPLLWVELRARSAVNTSDVQVLVLRSDQDPLLTKDAAPRDER